MVKNITPRVDGNIVRETEGYRIRYKFNGNLTLQNEKQNAISDYDLFKSIEASNYALVDSNSNILRFLLDILSKWPNIEWLLNGPKVPFD